jgi:acid phosphatase
MNSLRGPWLACLVMAVAACHSTARPVSTPQPNAAPAPNNGARHTHENLNAVLWTQTAVEYRAVARQTYRLAQLQLDAALKDPQWTAATEQTGASALPPAVVLDLDETVLDNSAFQARLVADSTPYHAAPYTEEAWNRWCEERKADAVPGAVEFLSYAKSRGVTPFYITNRDHAVEEATRDVLKRLDIPVEGASDTVLMRHEKGWDASDKSARRRFVAASFRILLLVGDNFEDFVTGARASRAERATLEQKYSDYWGTKWIVLPNATYGSWEQAIVGPSQSDAQILSAKYGALSLQR